MTIEWSCFAMEDRTGIFDYIEQYDPTAAVTVDERIMEQTQKLERFPDFGRPGRVEGTRELVVNNTPFIIAYCIRKDAVLILRILHGARSWPDLLPER